MHGDTLWKPFKKRCHPPKGEVMSPSANSSGVHQPSHGAPRPAGQMREAVSLSGAGLSRTPAVDPGCSRPPRTPVFSSTERRQVVTPSPVILLPRSPFSRALCFLDYKMWEMAAIRKDDCGVRGRAEQSTRPGNKVPKSTSQCHPRPALCASTSSFQTVKGRSPDPCPGFQLN